MSFIKENNYLSRCSYFHPNLTALHQVFQIMVPLINENGHFLVRNSFNKPGVLTVSVTDNRTLKHFHIKRQQNYFCLDELIFSSLNELILFCSNNDVPNIEGFQNIRLIHPIPFCSLKNSDSEFQSLSSKRKNSTPALSSAENIQMKQLTLKPKGSSFESLMLQKTKSKTASRKNQHTLNTRVNDKTKEVRSESDAIEKIFKLENEEDNIFCETGYLYYSEVRNPNECRVNSIIENLRAMECPDECHCGLPISDSQLPGGWSVHLSMEEETKGKVFYTSPDGTTSWKLPQQINDELTSKQKDFIKSLKPQKQSL